MSEAEITMFTTALGTAKHYLEYGAGGSTKLAVQVPGLSSITSVESDASFVNDTLMGDADIQAALQSGRLRFLFIDLGPTTDTWGYPLDRRKSYLWPNYALGPLLIATEWFPIRRELRTLRRRGAGRW